MTREEAIKILNSTYEDFCGFGNEDEYYEKTIEARNMAIEVLQTEPREDCISRQAAIDAIDALYLDGESAQGFTADANEDCLIGKYKAIEILGELPPVTPTQRTGKWIHHKDWEGEGWCGYECNQCGMGSDVDYKFCMRCGAKMESEGKE